MTGRAQMTADLELSASSPTKTFVVEAHADDPREMLAELVGEQNIEDTADVYLFKARVGSGSMWIDQLDQRFWSMHTDLPVREATTFLSPAIESRRDLDWVWLPSEHVRRPWPDAVSRRVRTSFSSSRLASDSDPAQDLRVQLAGKAADQLLALIETDSRYRSAVSFDSLQATVADPDFGKIEEAVNKMGRFAVSGDSFELHLQLVQHVVQRYSNLVRLCEERAIQFTAFGNEDDGGGYLTGSPLTIQFSREIDNMSRFTTELFSSRQPFRLWGVPEIHDSVAHVDAVDLHVGQVLPIDIGSNWMRIHLHSGSCGNTIARLITNLQHGYDGALTLEDPVLNNALRNSIEA